MTTNTNSSFESLLSIAMENSTKAVLTLLQERKCLTEFNQTLQKAAAIGNLHLAKALLDDGRADPHTMNNLAINLAAANGQPKMVKLLGGILK